MTTTTRTAELAAQIAAYRSLFAPATKPSRIEILTAQVERSFARLDRRAERNDRQARALARRLARVDVNTAIEIVEGSSAPRRAGNRGYWTTPSGKTIVLHPNAYGWRTWYHCSTLRVIVGAEWLATAIQ